MCVDACRHVCRHGCRHVYRHVRRRRAWAYLGKAQTPVERPMHIDIDETRKNTSSEPFASFAIEGLNAARSPYLPPWRHVSTIADGYANFHVRMADTAQRPACCDNTNAHHLSPAAACRWGTTRWHGQACEPCRARSLSQCTLQDSHWASAVRSRFKRARTVVSRPPRRALE